MLRVLMVCMGNICRSPIAEAVVRSSLQAAGLGDQVEVDSAGTHGYHAGERPDERARQVAACRGYDISSCRARKVSDDDFARFDLILAMDENNLGALRRLCAPEHHFKLKLFLPFSGSEVQEVPDPYYGNLAGFERVLELCEFGAAGVVRVLRSDYLPPAD